MLTKYTSLLAIPFVALIGCGGDDGHSPVVKMDAGSNNPPVDTPPAATCAFASTDMGTLSFFADQNGSPVEDDPNNADPNMQFSWFEVINDTMNPDNPLNGRKQLSIVAGLPVPPALPFNDNVQDLLIVNLLANTNNVFLINQNTNFNTDVAAETYSAETIIFGNVVGQNFQQFYYATSGSIKLTEVGTTAAENGGVTKGTVSATAYHELDDQGAEVATGCKPMLGGIEFALKTLATANGKPNTAISGHDMDDYKALIQRAHEMMAAQRH